MTTSGTIRTQVRKSWTVADLYRRFGRIPYERIRHDPPPGTRLQEYFEKGVRLVWFAWPRRRVVDVYTAPDHFTRLTVSMTLDEGDVLPGLAIPLGALFQMPTPPGKGTRKARKNDSDNGSWTLGKRRNGLGTGSASLPCPRRRLDIVW